MQQDLKLLSLWFAKNALTLSDKTKFMLFNIKKEINFSTDLFYHKIDCQTNLQCKNCIKIEKVHKIKYLGLIINSNLNWKDHVIKLKQEMYVSVRKFYFLQQLCPQNLMINLYHALVGSRLGYALTCWGGTYISTLRPLITLQKCIIRIILKKSRLEHCWPLFSKLKILPIRNLYVYKVLKIFFNRSVSEREPLLRPYGLRNIHNFQLTQPSLTLYLHFYTYSAPRLYNLTYYNIIHTQNKLNSSYIKGLKNWLLSIENIEHLL